MKEPIECPFCGSKNIKLKSWMTNDYKLPKQYGQFQFNCKTRGCSVKGPIRKSMEEAIQAWNTRAN